MDTLKTHRKLAEAEKSADRGIRFAEMAEGLPEPLEEEITAVDRRVTALEARPKLDSASIDIGKVKIAGIPRGDVAKIVIGCAVVAAVALLVALAGGWISF